MESEIVCCKLSDFPKSNQPTPFPMQGSKRTQVPIISRLIPAGQPNLIEPFCGSAAVSIGLRMLGLVSEVTISDINPSIIDLWQNILSAPDALADEYSQVWNAQFSPTWNGDYKAYFLHIRNHYNQRNEGDEYAAEFLFLLNRIVKAALRYSGTRMNQSADKRRVGAKDTTVRRRIFDTYAVMQGANARTIDWREALLQAVPDDIIYLDPPYQGTSTAADKRYIQGLDVDAFEKGINWAVHHGLKMIISYDALVGPVVYGRPLDPALKLTPIDLVTGISSQAMLLRKKIEAHETLYLSPALVDDLGGLSSVKARLTPQRMTETSLF
ncbi:hypothetical protein HMPREF1219_01691 [Corynebacterium pyruviciproducens ATCC BAA-1742]|uniref:site-specific DNA-methyltransferase (adenine-specific) n=1 Tax=Corynebacterium pyruviciproducens ATCC BAA-1742 TaxID=1125779 RepID=S2Z2L6_9CORY|nr:DNA adenine methylase [Corynebacterium pyruviciproducens]EPD68510.1 hypothetical protein HMPREF1219_01691 [Corynebacterium pyruviciproducens ATCC BAA-1742]